VAAGLRDVLRGAFDFVSERFRRRLAGLTDDELLWEPVAGCWTVRATADGFRADDAVPPPEPAPVTTIAWRLAHIGDTLVRHPLREAAFGRRAGRDVAPDHPHDAAGAVAYVDEAIRDWRFDLQSIKESRLLEPLGRRAGSFAKDPVVSFVLHVHTEFVHHTAEVALLRDLYRAQDR
jgi:DinB family protein